MNEVKFIDYWLKQIKGQSITTDKINTAYSILNGETPTDNCGSCVQSRFNLLINKMTSLIKETWVQEELEKLNKKSDYTTISKNTKDRAK